MQKCANIVWLAQCAVWVGVVWQASVPVCQVAASLCSVRPRPRPASSLDTQPPPTPAPATRPPDNYQHQPPHVPKTRVSFLAAPTVGLCLNHPFLKIFAKQLPIQEVSTWSWIMRFFVIGWDNLWTYAFQRKAVSQFSFLGAKVLEAAFSER